MTFKVWKVMEGGPSGRTIDWYPMTEQRVLAVYLRGSWRPILPLTRKRRVRS